MRFRVLLTITAQDVNKKQTKIKIDNVTKLHHWQLTAFYLLRHTCLIFSLFVCLSFLDFSVTANNAGNSNKKKET